MFSSWRDVLSILEHGLSINNIKYVRPLHLSKQDEPWLEFKAPLEEIKETANSLQSGVDWNSNNKRLLDDEAHKPYAGSNKEWAGLAGTRVLLLSIHHAGNGLNLTGANHVVFVEPLINPALEAQAIGRVYRFE